MGGGFLQLLRTVKNPNQLGPKLGGQYRTANNAGRPRPQVNKVDPTGTPLSQWGWVHGMHWKNCRKPTLRSLRWQSGMHANCPVCIPYGVAPIHYQDIMVPPVYTHVLIRHVINLTGHVKHGKREAVLLTKACMVSVMCTLCSTA